MEISGRKKDHVRISAGGLAEYNTKTGFDAWFFRHNALPEISYNEIDTSCDLLGRTFSFPLFISSMTGGYSGATAVNELLAKLAELHDIPMGVGSQRAMLENDNLTQSFSVVRDTAPNAFIASNIGGAQLIGGLSENNIRKLIDSIRANAIIVHLNPLQELMQPEGDRDFRGILTGIEQLVSCSEIPVIVKETGAGIDFRNAKRLLDIGVAVIDIAGAGGTSWAKVENNRYEAPGSKLRFSEWGIPTSHCLIELSKGGISANRIIASGGIRNGLDMSKALCLGAGFCASAQPIISELINNGFDAASELILCWKEELRTTMLLLGCKTIQELDIQCLIPH
jgi:isopentenyl-diphosphate Delta-isomerase